nr:CocE/NonD family hydrolase [Kineosporia rhizophila]
MSVPEEPVKSIHKAALALSPLVVLGVCAGPAQAADQGRVPEGAVWSQHYFPSSGGVELHADVLLPEKRKKGQKLPVILSVGPYFGHAGQMGPEGFKKTGPSARFNDLIEEGGALERGYALVMVDSRGFGGSTGCHDLAGPGEQADVKAAIGWAAKQPWSSGAVAMYGKSYDAITALVGNNTDHPALKATVAMEPIWEPYRNFRSDGVPRATIAQVAQQYITIATSPQMPDDSKRYRKNAAWETKNPLCLAEIMNGYRTADRDSAYWEARDLPAQAAGTKTPLFFTQGFTEWNTEAEGLREFLANHEGTERGWLGPWAHDRPNDRRPDGRLQVGRGGWFKEVFAFYDEHLKGKKPNTTYPTFAVQDSNGRWRGQDAWPLADAEAEVSLKTGEFVDDGRESTYVTHSEPVQKATRITGTPEMDVSADTDSEVQVKLYDVAPGGKAVMFDMQVSRFSNGRTAFELRSTDWVLKKGHSLAVEIGTVQPGIPTASDWLASPTGKTVKITDAHLRVALDDPADDRRTSGEPAPFLAEYSAAYTVDLKQRLTGSPSFALPLSR